MVSFEASRIPCASALATQLVCDDWNINGSYMRLFRLQEFDLVRQRNERLIPTVFLGLGELNGAIHMARRVRLKHKNVKE